MDKLRRDHRDTMQQAHEEYDRKTENISRREHEKISKLEKKVLSIKPRIGFTYQANASLLQLDTTTPA